MYNDPTLFLYFWIVFVSAFGMVLFIINWISVGKASVVYKYTTILMAAIFIKNSFEFYSLYIRNSGDLEGFLNFINCPLWDIRLLFYAIPLTAIVIHLSYRFFYLRKKDD